MHSCDVRRGLLWNYNELILANHGARISLKSLRSNSLRSVLLQVEESSNPKSQLNLVLIIFISALSSMQALCVVADFLNLEQN